jgi:L-threonylcarbamoyladenylate synthase
MDRPRQAEAEILLTDTPELFAAAVARAAVWLRAGEPVALPTETVYGLAANALDPAAVARVFAVKSRPACNPIIVHVADLGMARRCVSKWPPLADRLAAAFWPGPLTLVLPRSPAIPDLVTAGGATVGVRWPSHPFIQALIRACGFPLAAPSANRSTGLSPTTAEHVRRALGDRIRLIVDGGQCQVGIESTVVDLTGRPPRVLRPGMIHAESLLAVTGELGTGCSDEHGPLRSPGLLERHYSPRARLVVWEWSNDSELAARLEAHRVAPEALHVIAHTHIPRQAGGVQVSVIPHDPEAFARALYAELHRCDEAGARLIVVERLPETAAWRAIADRLERAAA